ncbi:hypothetical protein [Miltoncostaea marina]|uniref:hypothetical protein n=1 Tax=Miltoncostaea marina TaxID=2843215 RepID=UPI001C3C988A|nr:hypothetical protein [Miltoncostaea marina]
MATRRLELGFEGGTVLRLTVDSGVADEVTGALAAQSASGWRAVESEEGTFWVDLAELVYVRLPPGEAPGRVGFGGI